MMLPISPSPPLQRAWYRLTEKQKNYIKIVACHALHYNLDFLASMAQSGCAALVAIKISGVLETRSSIELIERILAAASSATGGVISLDPLFTASNVSQDLGYTLDRIFVLPIGQLVLVSSGAWIGVHTLFPPILRRLKSREEACIQKFVHLQNSTALCTLQQTTRSSSAQKISWLFEYLTPFLLIAPSYALILHAIENFGGDTHLPDGRSISWSAETSQLSLNVTATINDVVLQILPGSDPIAPSALSGVFLCGVATFICKALCNIRHTIRERAAAAASRYFRV